MKNVAHSDPDSRVLILGPSLVRNELAAYTLRTHGVPHTEVRSTVAISGETRTSETVVYLIDSESSDWPDVLLELRTEGLEVLRSAVGLTNLARGQGIEREAFRYGVTGYFYRDDTISAFIEGVESLITGHTWISHEVLLEIAGPVGVVKRSAASDSTGLTARESQILRMLSQGAENVDIARRLLISRHTVRTHLTNAFRKINAPNRQVAAKWAARHLRHDEAQPEARPSYGSIHSAGSQPVFLRDG